MQLEKHGKDLKGTWKGAGSTGRGLNSICALPHTFALLLGAWSELDFIPFESKGGVRQGRRRRALPAAPGLTCSCSWRCRERRWERRRAERPRGAAAPSGSPAAPRRPERGQGSESHTLPCSAASPAAVTSSQSPKASPPYHPSIKDLHKWAYFQPWGTPTACDQG